MTKKRTDFRALKARRQSALNRPELRRDPKPAAPSQAEIAAAAAIGKLQKLPQGKRTR